MPIKALKAKPIRPVISMVIPKPLSPEGTMEYFNFSRIAARAMMAKKNPKPDPKPYDAASMML